MGEQLGRLLDPQALDADAGPRARFRIDVPAEWLDEGAEIEAEAPARLTCARCDGGGCDGCGRSGVLRAPKEASERRVTAKLPKEAPEALSLRIVQPFGGASAITQLMLEIRAGETASAGVSRIDPPEPEEEEPAPLAKVERAELEAPLGIQSAMPVVVTTVLCVAAAALALLLGR